MKTPSKTKLDQLVYAIARERGDDDRPRLVATGRDRERALARVEQQHAARTAPLDATPVDAHLRVLGRDLELEARDGRLGDHERALGRRAVGIVDASARYRR